MPTCMECGSDLASGRAARSFCSRDHKQAYHNRMIKRGNKMIPLVYRWRALRSSDADASNTAFSRLCSLLSDWIEADRCAGRAVPSMPDLGVEGAVVYRPTRSVEAMAKADREMSRNHRINNRNMGIK